MKNYSKGETITTEDIYRTRRERARTYSDEEEKLTD
jgi:hypothetical protein